ncbi:MAG TPA: HPr-rel-A system PqqD family peptide chaperone [Allosphingosinicella sp.]|jgi:PqqD family protein of HPr-rel-A system
MTGGEPRYRADPPDAVRCVAFEGLTLLFHRPSGMTHVLAPPAPQILDALRDGFASEAELKRRIAEQFELVGEDDALAARLNELVAAGLVERR